MMVLFLVSLLRGIGIRLSVGDCKCKERKVFNVAWSDVEMSLGEEEDDDDLPLLLSLL